MPGRKFSAGTGYRYGFNGKEQDSEVKGSGAQYDYGFRIYDARLGRFLSMDPLTKSYPALTPFQFASNNPVEGVDVDGREYLSSKEVRIEVIRGQVKLKIENMTTVVKNNLTALNNDPKNWKPGEIGVDFSVGSFSIKSITPEPERADINLTATGRSKGPDFQPGVTKVENPTAASTGQPDKRYKQRTVSSASPGGSKGLAVFSVLIDAAIIGTNLYIQNRSEKDEGLIKDHINYFKLAAADVNAALQKGMIPKEYQNEQSLSDIINVVLAGTSNTADPATKTKILEIGKNIYNTLSVKRNAYTGKIIELSKLDNYSIKVRETNPAYDAEYIKQNPPLGEQTKSDPPKPNP